LNTYDPRDVNVIIDGKFLTGFAEGTFVSCEKAEDNWTPHVGAQGEVDRARNVNPLGLITVTLKHTSPSNAVLNRLAKSKNTFPAQLIDRNSPQTVIGGSRCWIVKQPNMERSNEITGQEWQIQVADYDVEVK
jgi:hypothetical protein